MHQSSCSHNRTEVKTADKENMLSRSKGPRKHLVQEPDENTSKQTQLGAKPIVHPETVTKQEQEIKQASAW